MPAERTKDGRSLRRPGNGGPEGHERAARTESFPAVSLLRQPHQVIQADPIKLGQADGNV